MVGPPPGPRVALALGVVAAILFTGCFNQPVVVVGQGNTPGWFFLRVTGDADGLDPAWRTLTADFANARLVRGTGEDLRVPPNTPRNEDLDVLDLARRGDQRTVAHIQSKNERFVGFTFDMLDLNGTRTGDPERGEPELVDVDFTSAGASLQAPYPVFIVAGLPAYPGAPYAHLVEVTVVLDLGESIRPGPEGNYVFSPRLATTIFKVDGRIAGERGPSEEMRRRADEIAGTFYPPIASGAAYLDDRLVGRRDLTLAKVLNDPLPPTPTVSLNARGSRDRDYYGDVVQYRWSPGDGTPAAYGSVLGHRYASGGLYDVGLLVSDNDGMTDFDAFPLFVGWALAEAKVGGGNDTEGLLVNVRDHQGGMVGDQAFDDVTLQLPLLDGDSPYRPGMILLELTWDNQDADLDWWAKSGSRVDASSNRTGWRTEQILLVGKPYLPNSVTAQVAIVKGPFANYQLNATVFHVPDIEAGWDGHADHEHPRHVGVFRE